MAVPILLILLLGPPATTPPVPIVIQADHVLVAQAPEETRPAVALVLGAASAADARAGP